jgi:hypothetical protein
VSPVQVEAFFDALGRAVEGEAEAGSVPLDQVLVRCHQPPEGKFGPYLVPLGEGLWYAVSCT